MANPTLIPEFAPGKNWNDVIVPNGADLDGTGDYISTPDAAAHDITTNFEGRAQITPDDNTPAADVEILSRWESDGDERGYSWHINADGKLEWEHTTDGTAGTLYTKTSTVANGVTDGKTWWAAVTVIAATGTVTHYWHATEHTPPAALADWDSNNAVAGAATSIYNADAEIACGMRDGDTNDFAGIIHEVQFWDDTVANGGTLLANPRFHDSPVWAIDEATSGTDFQAFVWTLEANAVIVGSWINLSADVRSPFRIKQGRQTPFTRMRPSTLTFRLGNSSGDYDPENTGGTYTGQLVPLVPVRWRMKHNGIIYNRWRGFATSWTVEAPGKTGDTYTDVKCVDALTVMQLLEFGTAYDVLVAEDSPVGFWKLDELTGTTATDDGSGGNDGTYTNTPTLGQDGPLSNTKGVLFAEASSEEVSIGTLTGVSPNSDFTVELFINPDDPVTNAIQAVLQVAIESNETLGVWINDSEPEKFVGFQFPIVGSGWQGRGVADVPIDDTGWQHIVFVIDATAKTAVPYIDGQAAETLDLGPWDQTRTTSDMSVRIAAGGSLFFFEGEQSRVAIYDKKLSAERIILHAAAAHNGFPQELTSERVASLLDVLEWPSLARSLSVGLSTMVADATISGSLLTAAFAAQDTEDGELFVDGEGLVVFTNRTDRDVSAYATMFSNDGSDIPYAYVRPVRDKTLLRNVSAVTGSDGTIYEARDDTSVASHGPRTLPRVTQTVTAGEQQNYADWLPAEFGSPRTSMKLVLIHGRTTTDAAWAAMLGRELGDLVKVETDPIHGGAQQSFDMFVEEMTLTGKGVTGMEMLIGLSPAKNQRMFTLDDDVLGELDGDNEGLLGW